jgi:ABC-type transport system substrate-binding protein
LALLVIALGGCRARQEAPEPVTFRFGIAAPLTSLDPVQTVDALTLELHLNTHSLLFRQRSNGTLEPSLALEARSNDRKTRWEITIRDNVWFPAPYGHAVTAEDVAATLLRAAEYEGSRVRWVFSRLARDANGQPAIAARDATTVVLEFQDPVDLPRYLALPQLGILPKEVCSRAKFDFANKSYGSGPFFVEAFDPERIVLRANDRGWPRPHVAVVELHVVRDAEVAFAMVASGRLDGVELSLLQQLRMAKGERLPQGVRLITVPRSVHWEFLAFHTQLGPCSDKSLRRALLFSLDRRDLCTGPLGGTCSPTNFVGPQLGTEFKEDPLYRPDWARSEWQQAGQRPKKLEVLVVANERSVTMGRSLASQWQKTFKVGVALVQLDPGPLFGRVMSQEPFELADFWVQPLADLPEIWFLAWQPGDFPPRGRNFTRYSNPAFADLFALLRRESKIEVNSAIWQRLEDLLEADPPAIPLFQRRADFVVRDGFDWSVGPVLALEFFEVRPAGQRS